MLCWETEFCKATWRNWRERRGACTHCGQLKEYPTLSSLRLPAPLPPKNTFSYFEVIPVYFCLLYFRKFNFTYFSHNFHNYSMFRDVPKCSGMFRDVPCSWFYRRPLHAPSGGLLTLFMFVLCIVASSFHWFVVLSSKWSLTDLLKPEGTACVLNSWWQYFNEPRGAKKKKNCTKCVTFVGLWAKKSLSYCDSSSTDVTRALRWGFLGGYVSWFCFVPNWRKTSNVAGVSSWITLTSKKERSFGPRYVLIHSKLK